MLHYVLELRFGKVCEQKRKKKTLAFFYFSRFFSCVFIRVLDTNMLVIKT